MKNFIYMDNFRGFDQALMELSDVNFFVGENSTGKSSVLAIMDIMSSWKFSSTFDLVGENCHFGTYSDIATDLKRDVIIGKSFVPDSGDGICFLVVKYHDKNGLSSWKSAYYLGVSGCLKIRMIGSAQSDGGCNYKHLKKGLVDISEQSINFLIDEIDSLPEKEYKPKDDHYRWIKDPMYWLVQIGNEVFAQNSFSYNGLMTMRPVWMAPIRSTPKKTYDEYRADYSPQGDHTPYMIKSLMSKDESKGRFKRYMKDFGKESGLFGDIDIKKYGKLETSPFELDVKIGGRRIPISNVGYGVSQSLPMLVEFFVRRRSTLFFVQQPEVHLHPRAQAAFGKLIYDLHCHESKLFVVETHSDFLIDRFRSSVRGGSKAVSSSIFFFCRDGKKNTVTKISIDKHGDISEGAPDKYREFFINEALENIGI